MIAVSAYYTKLTFIFDKQYFAVKIVVNIFTRVKIQHYNRWNILTSTALSNWMTWCRALNISLAIPVKLNLRFLQTSPKFDRLDALINGSGWLICAKNGFKSLFLWAGVISPKIRVTFTKASPILVRSSIPKIKNLIIIT